MTAPLPGSRSEEPDETRVVTLRRQLLTARREIASFRGLRYWCASCAAHTGALLLDGDVRCERCAGIITSVQEVP